MTTKITDSAAIAVARYLPRVSVDDAREALNAALPYLTTEPDVTTARTLTPAQSAMIWDALTVRIADPVMAHEKDDARALRDLLTSGRITVTPYES